MIRTTSGVFDPVSGEIKITPASHSLLRLLTQILVEKNHETAAETSIFEERDRERKHMFFLKSPPTYP